MDADQPPKPAHLCKTCPICTGRAGRRLRDLAPTEDDAGAAAPVSAAATIERLRQVAVGTRVVWSPDALLDPRRAPPFDQGPDALARLWLALDEALDVRADDPPNFAQFEAAFAFAWAEAGAAVFRPTGEWLAAAVADAGAADGPAAAFALPLPALLIDLSAAGTRLPPIDGRPAALLGAWLAPRYHTAGERPALMVTASLDAPRSVGARLAAWRATRDAAVAAGTMACAPALVALVWDDRGRVLTSSAVRRAGEPLAAWLGALFRRAFHADHGPDLAPPGACATCDLVRPLAALGPHLGWAPPAAWNPARQRVLAAKGRARYAPVVWKFGL